MVTNYVLIDFESVQPKSLEPLAQEHFRLLVFVGAGQAKLPFEIAASLQPFGPRAEYIKISGHGSNALDFHIAYYIGKLAVLDPTACFHIVSKDAGFDPLIQHLASKQVSVSRVKAIAEVPLVKASCAGPPEERLDLALAKLRRLNATKPRTVKALRGTIAAMFRKQLSEDEISNVLQELVSKGHVAVDGAKVAYASLGDG